MKQVKRFLEDWKMLPSGGVVLCAVSGGADSVCLLHYLYTLAPQAGFSLAAAHYNHQLRAAADADEAFVRDLCADWSVPFYAGRGDVRAAAKEGGWTVEEAARRLRYDFLEEAAQQCGAARIATAHNADDNAETVLMNLLRGTGPEGLGGIPPVRGRLIRPFLVVSRSEIEAYLVTHALPHREDETNRDETMTRNYIRHQVMPRLAQVNARASEHIGRTAFLTRRENEFLDALARERMAALESGGGCAALPRAALRRAPEVLRLRMIRLMIDALATGKKDFTSAHIEQTALLAVYGRAGGQLSLPAGVLASVDGDSLLLRRQSAVWGTRPLAAGGKTVWGDYTLTCVKTAEFSLKKEDTIYIKCDTINPNLTPSVGVWRTNDRLLLPGAKGPRSLKRLFVDHGVAVQRRETTPVLYMGDVTAAVWCVGTASEFLPQTGHSAWAVTIERADGSR